MAKKVVKGTGRDPVVQAAQAVGYASSAVSTAATGAAVAGAVAAGTAATVALAATGVGAVAAGALIGYQLYTANKAKKKARNKMKAHEEAFLKAYEVQRYSTGRRLIRHVEQGNIDPAEFGIRVKVGRDGTAKLSMGPRVNWTPEGQDQAVRQLHTAERLAEEPRSIKDNLWLGDRRGAVDGRKDMLDLVTLRVLAKQAGVDAGVMEAYETRWQRARNRERLDKIQTRVAKLFIQETGQSPWSRFNA